MVTKSTMSLVQVLRKVEWAKSFDYNERVFPSCPVCRGIKPGTFRDHIFKPSIFKPELPGDRFCERTNGHETGCELVRFIRMYLESSAIF